jgi:electron transfer flavoprotein-quinone oxidoreductase
VQEIYPALLCDLVEGVFTVDNRRPKPGLARIARRAARRRGLRLGAALSDGVAALRSFG